MAQQDEKAALFTKRLLANPTLKYLPPLLREEQILQFLQVNARQLYPTLSSGAFFPGMNWEQIAGILQSALITEIDSSLLPGVTNLVEDDVDLAFIQFLRQQNMPQDRVKRDIVAFVHGILKRPEGRREYVGAYNAIGFSIVGRYIDEFFDRRSYVHFELTKVQRLRMSKEEVKNFVKLSLLLKPTIFVVASAVSGGKTEQPGGASGRTVQMQFIEKTFAILKDKLPVLPDQVLKSALHANGSFLENRSMEATARLSAVFSSMCRNHRPNMKIDRGADTADKSWINIARRNYKFNGFDVKMLDEFYKTAAENGW